MSDTASSIQPASPEPTPNQDLHLEKTVKVGDLLTSVSILVSAIGLMITVSHNSDVQQRQQADQIRNSAATTLAKIERREQLSLFAFDELQPTILKASTMFARNSDPDAARDLLWAEISNAKSRTGTRLLNEQIQSAYTALYGYSPDIRPIFKNTMAQLEDSEDKMFERLYLEVQKSILDLAADKPQSAADVGDALRQIVGDEREIYRKELDKELLPIQEFLAAMISKSDDEILAKHKR